MAKILFAYGYNGTEVASHDVTGKTPAFELQCRNDLTTTHNLTSEDHFFVVKDEEGNVLSKHEVE